MHNRKMATGPGFLEDRFRMACSAWIASPAQKGYRGSACSFVA